MHRILPPGLRACFAGAGCLLAASCTFTGSTVVRERQGAKDRLYFTETCVATLGPCAFTGYSQHREWLEIPRGRTEIPGSEVVQQDLSLRKFQGRVTISADQKRVEIRLKTPLGGGWSQYEHNGRYRLITPKA
ncbi:MAG: hypothetical protein JWO82_947 [Akkermansiaceae bacterium]|nr:hypothetical protein [Akkermansiaceae bacterium]